MKDQSRESRVESRVPAKAGARRLPRPSTLDPRPFRSAFTLIELLTVIAIIGVLAALLAPVLKNFSKPDVAVAATRQMLDDCARARQVAISQRTTVYMVFIPTNFWSDPFKLVGGSGWTALPVPVTTSTIVTQMYAAQWNGYMMVSLRDIGDQPGRSYARDVVRVKTLPDGSFFAPFKFTAPTFISGSPAPYPISRPDLPIYGFLRTNTIPFPTADVETNASLMNNINFGLAHFVTLPYIAFNYLGQLTSGDGSVLPYDENIPLAYGSIVPPHSASTKSPVQGLPSANELPPGNSTNISFNIIHVDRLTGRARLERQDVL